MIDVPDTGASWGAAWRVRLDASARGQYGNAASRSVAVERTCMGFLLRRAEPADPTPIPNPERSVLDRHPSTTVGAQHHAWSEACLAFGLKKRTLDDRKTERDVLLVTFHPRIPMPDITLIIQIPGRVRNSLVSKHTVDVDGDEAAAELPEELGARGGLQPDGSLARNIILRAAGDVSLCGYPSRRLSLQEQRLGHGHAISKSTGHGPGTFLRPTFVVRCCP